MVTATVEKRAGGWCVVSGGEVLKGGFARKLDAVEQLSLAMGLVAMMDAAADAKMTRLDLEVWGAVDQLGYKKSRVLVELDRMRSQSESDLERLKVSGRMWYDGSNYARLGADVALANAEYVAALEAFRSTLRMVCIAQPHGDSAVARAVVNFLTMGGLS